MIGQLPGHRARLGHYRILEKIGEGGMGVVYRAHDERLERDVALKVLPPGALADESARKRFRAEALALSHLNHPNIASAYDFDTEDGMDFLVTELVPGVTLDEKAASGPLPEKETVQIGLQLVEGLDTAHHEGVIHRDLKPSNLRVTPDGRLKVLDFGLAKRTDPLDHASVTRSSAGDRELAGTLAYMAPEQLKGEKVDYRADLWAVGVILYELATGQRPFGGKTTTGMADEILHAAAVSPQVSQPRLSVRLADVILKCLEKEPGNRYQSAKELAVDLRRLSTPSTAVMPPGAIRSRRAGPLTIAIAVAALAILAAATYYVLSAYVFRPKGHVYEPIAFTTMQGVISEPTFSPDANEIAFWWQKHVPSDRRIYTQALGNTVARQLIEDNEPNRIERAPRWFPDGRTIAYIRQVADGPEEIWTVPRTGGTPRKLLSFRRLFDFDVAPDGKTIVTAEPAASEETSSLYLTSLHNGNRQRLTQAPGDRPSSVLAGKGGDLLPRFSPDGRDVGFVRYEGATADLFRIPVTGGEAERLTEDLIVGVQSLPSYTWDADGKSLLVIAGRSTTGRRRGWWRLRLRGKQWEPLSISGGNSPAVSNNGLRLAFVQASSITNIWRYDLPHPGFSRGERLNLTQSTSTNWGPSYSPDGSRFVFDSSRTGHYEIYVASSDGSNPVQLTSFQGNDAGSPRWSPDGKQIAFDYRPAKQAQVFVVDANGGPPRQMTFDEADSVLPRYSRDGQWIYFARLRKGGSDLWKLPSGGGKPVFVAADILLAEESSDGKTLYYTKLEDRQMALYARSVAHGEEQLVLQEAGDTIGGVNPFVVLSNGIYYRRKLGNAPGHELLFYDFATRRRERLLQLPFESVTAASISPDRAYLLVPVPEPQSNIMLVENFR